MEEGVQVVTIFGFSDARITVYKRGGAEVLEQGRLCDHLGTKVAPRIVMQHEDGYEMEMLSPAVNRGVVQMAEVLQRLRMEVWPRRQYKPSSQTVRREWLDSLISWANLSPWLIRPIRDVYPEEPVTGYSLIHGDPALSNLMLRGGYYVLTDPMPRLEYRREIPDLKEVDHGKLVQSACGWERMLGSESGLWEEPMTMLGMLPEKDRPKAALWGGIHLARVAIRARTKKLTAISEWAETWSVALVRRFM